MKIIKIYTISFLIILSIIFTSFSNEKTINNNIKKIGITNLSYYFHFKNLTKFESSSNDNVKNFTDMGIAGAVVFGISWVFTVPGVVLLIYGFLFVPAAATTSASSFSEALADALVFGLASISLKTLFIILGSVLIAVGGVMFLIGLPIMIAGFATASYYKSKVSLLINNDNKGLKCGLTIKL